MLQIRGRSFALYSLFLLLLLSACAQQPSPFQRNPTTVTPGPTQQPVTLAMLQQRTLHIPTLASGHGCPVAPAKQVVSSYGIAIGDGPAYAAIGLAQPSQHPILYIADAQHFMNGQSQGWGGAKVFWFIRPEYYGPLLIRGQQLDGSHQVRFNLGATSEIALNIPQGDTQQWYGYPSYTRLQVAGCYAYQVDGTNFSQILVFQAAVKNPVL